MVEIKMTFGSADDAIAFLAERASAKTVTNSTPTVATAESAPATTKAATDPKPAKAQKAAEASPSAAPAEAASPAPAPAAAPSPAPAPVAPAGKPMEYASSDLPKRIAEMVGLGHTAAVKALLGEFGAKKGPEIPADKLNEFDAKLKALETSLAAG